MHFACFKCMLHFGALCYIFGRYNDYITAILWTKFIWGYTQVPKTLPSLSVCSESNDYLFVCFCFVSLLFAWHFNLKACPHGPVNLHPLAHTHIHFSVPSYASGLQTTKIDTHGKEIRGLWIGHGLLHRCTIWLAMLLRNVYGALLYFVRIRFHGVWETIQLRPKLLKVKPKLSWTIVTITYVLETQHKMYPIKQFPDLNFYNKLTSDHLETTNETAFKHIL